MLYLQFKAESRRILYQFHFLVITFFLALVGCQKSENQIIAQLTQEEKKDLDYFFRLLCFDHYGSFVLFGSKPLCEMCFFDTGRDPESFSPFDRNPAKGWQVWEKIRSKVSCKQYLLIKRSVRNNGMPGSDKDYGSIFLMDIQKTALILAENYEIFKACTDENFHPLEVIFELENPDSSFWNKVFSLDNHIAKGLLFGFGKRNSVIWSGNLKAQSHASQVSKYTKPCLLLPSTKPIQIPSGLARNHMKFGKNIEELTIPFFWCIEEDEIKKQYEQEKQRIQQIYRGKDVVEITLQRIVK